MTTLFQDLRFGLRLLRRQPGFTLVALLVLTVGIGVNTAAFSLVNALMLKPRVGNIDAELAGVYSRNRERPGEYREFTWADYAQLRDRPDLFRSVTAHGFGLAGLQEGDATRRVFVDIVTANYFETFGVQLPVGRPFTAAEERPGADLPVVVLSDGAWRRLGGSPDVLGRTIKVNQRTFTVVGVAPRGFGGSMVMASPELWVPTGMYEAMAYDLKNDGKQASLSDSAFRTLIVVARLDPGATIDSMSGSLAAATRQMAELDPAANAGYELQLAPLSRVSVSDRPQTDSELTGVTAMLVSLASVVLLIASFNLANMLLARGQARRKELAIRLAIGGSRQRLMRQLATESLLLALLGGAGGLLLSWWGTRFIFTSLPPLLPISLAFDPAPDARVIAAAVGFSVVAALFFGMGPAWTLARADALPALKDQAGEIRAGRRFWRRLVSTRDTLVMGQVALTFVMLTAAGLFVRGALEAAGSDPGFTLDRGLIVNIDASLAGYTPERARTYYRDALAALRAQPGVAAAGFASHMPFGEFQSTQNVQRPGPRIRLEDATADQVVTATTVSVSSGYFDAMGIPVLRGRDFTDSEALSTGGERLVIVDEQLARHLFGDTDPVGREVQTAEDGKPVLLRVVGVVGGVRPELFSTGPEPFIYLPFGQRFQSNLYLHARTSAPTAAAERAMLPAVGQALHALDPVLPFVALETRPMFRERNLLLAVLRTAASIFSMFGLAALFLAAAGVYGVKAYLVSRRTREIGIRIALGAESRDVVGMVLGEGLALGLAGLVLGVGLSIVTGDLLRGMLFQGRALDLPVIAVAAVTLVGSMLLASWLPARRAMRVPPTTALRAQ
jgi:putative ABC transport system permease protein